MVDQKVTTRSQEGLLFICYYVISVKNLPFYKNALILYYCTLTSSMALGMALSVCVSVSQPLVQTEISQQLRDGLP